jgi:Cu-processing system permease protein
MTAATTIALYALRESLRRRVFLVVALLSLLSGAIYVFGVDQAFDSAEGFSGQALIEEKTLIGATLLGVAMFGTLFLGAVLAVFLTLGAVRGDAERGLLQPVLVRPVRRSTFLIARFAGAAAVSAGYAVVAYAVALLAIGAIGGWWPDRVLMPGINLAGGVVVIAALSLLGSVFLSTTANGITVFMVFGAGLLAGLLGQVGEALRSDTLETIAAVAAWLVPFEALYQAALEGLTTDTRGITGVVVALGPFGGAEEGGLLLWPWTIAYLALIWALAIRGFARADL